MKFPHYPEDVIPGPIPLFAIVSKKAYSFGQREYYRAMPQNQISWYPRIPQFYEIDTILRILTWFRYAPTWSSGQRVADATFEKFWSRWNIVQYDNFAVSPLVTVYSDPRSFFDDWKYLTASVQRNVEMQLLRMGL